MSFETSISSEDRGNHSFGEHSIQSFSVKKKKDVQIE